MRTRNANRGSRRLALLVLISIVLATILFWLLSHSTSSGVDALTASPRDAGADRTRAAAIDARLEPRATSATATDTVVPAAEEASSHVVTGSVRDERTNEPVPYMTIELNGGGVAETLTTDAAGNFASTVRFPAGVVSAELSDIGWPVGHARLDHAALAFDIAVRIGPTYPLAIEPPLPLDGLQVRLTERTSGPYAAILDVDANGELHFVEPAERDFGAAPVRFGVPPWIRFPHACKQLAPDVSAWLMLEDARGQRWCEARATDVVGIQPKVVCSTQLGCATIAGNVYQSVTPARAAFVCAVPELAADNDALGWHQTPVGSDGRFTLDGLRAGRWRIAACAEGLVLDQTLVDVARLSFATVELRLTEGAVIADPSNPSMRYPFGPLELWNAVVPELQPFLPPFVGIGTIEHVPSAPLHVMVWRVSDIGRLQPRARVWSGNGPLVRGPEHAHVDVRAEFQLPSDKVLEPWFVLESDLTSVSRDGSEVAQLETNALVRWLAGARGCAPAFGMLADAEQSDKGLLLRVRLEPGWGAQIVAQELARDAERRGALVEAVAERVESSGLDSLRKWQVLDTARDALQRTRPPVNGLRIVVLDDELDAEPLAWSTSRGVGDAVVALRAAPRRLGVVLDRTRFAVRALEPNYPTTPRGKRIHAGMRRHRLVCERLEPAQRATPPVSATANEAR